MNEKHTSFLFDGFISYSSKDQEWVKKLVRELDRHYAQVWVDYERINPGDSVPAAINQGLEQSRKLVVVLTKNYLESEWCTSENSAGIVAAYNENKRLIPLLVEDCKIPPLLVTIQLFLKRY